MKNIKKLLTGLLASVLAAASLASCGEKKEDTYITLEQDLGREVYAIGFRPNDIALTHEVQNILDEMASDDTSKKISEKWFGTDLIVRDLDFPTPKEDVDGDTSLEDLKKRGEFVIGLDDSFPPMGFRDENNELVGVDIEMAAEVAKRLGVTFRAQPINWDTKELELENGNIDCIWNGMTVTEERKEAMFLTKPYLNNRQVIITKESSGIKEIADLEGKIVGLQKGSSAEQALAKSEVAGKVEVQTYDENVTAFMDLEAGRVDAFLVDEVVGNYIVATRTKK